MCLAVAMQQCLPKRTHPSPPQLALRSSLPLKSHCHTVTLSCEWRLIYHCFSTIFWSQLLFDPRRCGVMRLNLDVLAASRWRVSLVRDGGQCGAFPDITSPCMRGRWSLRCSAILPGADPIKLNTRL